MAPNRSSAMELFRPKSAGKTSGLCCEQAFRPTPTRRSGPPDLQKNHLVSLDNVLWRATGLRRRVGVWFARGFWQDGTSLRADLGRCKPVDKLVVCIII